MTVRTTVFGYLDGNLSVDVYNARSLPFLIESVPCVAVNNPAIEATYDGTKENEAQYVEAHAIQIVALVKESANWADEAEAIIGEVKAILLPADSDFNAAFDYDPNYAETYEMDADGEYILGFGSLAITVSNTKTY